MIRTFGKLCRGLPDFPGKRRIARLLLGKRLEEVRNLDLRGRYGCMYRLPNIKEAIGFELYLNGVFEKEIIDFLYGRLRPGDVLIDLGANIGAIAIPVSKRMQGVKLICVEASPFVIPYLRHNFKINHIQNYKLIEAVVSDKQGEKIPFFHPSGQFGKGSVTNLFSAASSDVPSVTLDQIVEAERLGKVHLIKMDIEGYEFFALKGGAGLFGRADAPDLLFEFVDYAEAAVEGINPGDAQRLALEYGYRLYKLEGSRLIALTAPVLNGYAMIFATKKHV